MDKTFSFVQLIIAAVIFLCVVSGVVGHIALGHITSVFGFIVCAVFSCAKPAKPRSHAHPRFLRQVRHLRHIRQRRSRRGCTPAQRAARRPRNGQPAKGIRPVRAGKCRPLAQTGKDTPLQASGKGGVLRRRIEESTAYPTRLFRFITNKTN